MNFLKITSAAVVLLAVSACGGVNDPFIIDHSTGSCQFTTMNGYDYCEDFLGSEYNQSVAQNVCATGMGTWSPNACPTKGAIGTCAIEIGTGDAENVRYTYYPSSVSGAAPATPLTAETACGLAGGTFAAVK